MEPTTAAESGLWYIAVEGGQPAGPFTAEQIIESWRAGRLNERSLCCREGAPRWIPLADAEPLAAAMLRAKHDPALIRFVCACGNEIIMGCKFAGRRVKCKQCGAVVTVPVSVDASAAARLADTPRPPSSGKVDSRPLRQIASTASGPADERSGHPGPSAITSRGNGESVVPSNGSRAHSTSSSARSGILPELTPLQQILAELGSGETLARKDAAPSGFNTAVIDRDGSGPKTASAGYKPVMERFCHVCGTRVQEHQKRCINCLAPLTPEEIAADAATRRKPLLPWLPRLHLSGHTKFHMVAVTLLAATGLFYAFWLHPALRNKAIVQAHVDLAEKHLASTLNPQDPMKLLRLTWEPGLVPHRPSEVKVIGKVEVPQGGTGAAIAAVGDGLLSLVDRTLRLDVVLDGRTYSYKASLPPPLHLAALYGNPRRMELLLSDPAVDVNEADEHGSTALHLAAVVPGDHLRRVQVLLKHKANGAIRDEKNLTPLLIARAVQNGWCAYELDPRPLHAKPAPPKYVPSPD